MNRSINLVIVNDALHVDGGGAQVALSSAIGLKSRGYDVVFFGAVEPIDRDLQAAGVTVVSMAQATILQDKNRLRAATQGIWNSTAYDEMRKLLASLPERPTVVHVHGWSKSLSSSVLKAAKDAGAAVVLTLHDYLTVCPNGAFYDHPANEICVRRPMSFECIARNCDARSGLHKAWRVARQVVQSQIGHLPEAVDHFIAVGKFSADILRPLLPKDRPITLVSNPIDAVQREPVKPAASKIFTYVGRFSREKGVLLFAEAAREAAIEAVFVGAGDLQAEIESIGAGATFTGWLDHSATLQHLRRSRVLVSPSLWYEGLPLVVAEAAAAGIPSIVPSTSAARDLVEHGVNGLIFEGGKHDSLVEALRSYANDSIVSTHGRNAYDTFWAAPATMERHVESLEKVYNSLAM